MSYKTILYIYGLILITLISVHSITADVDDNEVSDGGPDYYMLQGVKVYQIDRQCAMVGGLCVPHIDCLEPTSNRGLCPSNSHRGVECCYELLQGVKVYQIDRQCAMVGGLCVPHIDCLEPTSNRGLCPSNSHRGVECCYELPVRPAPCAEHMGECMDRCHKTLMRPGTDCQNGQICCVLI